MISADTNDAVAVLPSLLLEAGRSGYTLDSVAGHAAFCALPHMRATFDGTIPLKYPAGHVICDRMHSADPGNTINWTARHTNNRTACG